jgi:hypothetical protein
MMSRQTRKAFEDKSREQWAETLKEVRHLVEAHAQAGESGEPAPPRRVRERVVDMLDLIDALIEEITSDRDEDIDDAVEDLGS